MIRVAIVEDDESCAALLREYLKRYASDNAVQVSSEWFPSGLSIISDYKPDFDIILLDIQMPGINGMEVAHIIRETDCESIIIFVTNMAQYAIQGYEVDALDYILKPIKYASFALKFRRACSRIPKDGAQSIKISCKDGMRLVPIKEIYYIDVRSHILQIHTEQGTYTMTGSLKAMEELLKDAHFSLCNKSELVNLEQISLVKKGSVIVGGTELYTSRRRKEEFMQEVTSYFGGVGK